MGTGEDDSQQAAEAMVQLSGIGFYTQPQGGGRFLSFYIEKSCLTLIFFFTISDDSIDIDPNYDPSDFLSMNNRNLGASQSNTFATPAPPPPPTSSRDFDIPAAPIEYKFDPTNMQFTPMHEPAYPVMDFTPKPSVSHSYEQMAAAIQEQMQYEANEQQAYQQQQQQQSYHEENMPVYQFGPQTTQHFTHQQVITKQEPQDHHEVNEMETQQGERPLHDDLAVSDSDEEQAGLRMEEQQNNNEDEGDGGLWF